MYAAAAIPLPVGRYTWNSSNPPARGRSIAIRDIHRVLTGFGTDTDNVGEVEVSAWEVGAGLGLTVGEARAHMQIPVQGVAARAGGLHPMAPTMRSAN